MQPEPKRGPRHTTTDAEVGSSPSTDLRRGPANEEAESEPVNSPPPVLAPDDNQPAWKEISGILREPMTILLFATGVAYAVLGGLEAAVVMLVVIVAILCVKVLYERRADRALVALRKMAHHAREPEAQRTTLEGTMAESRKRMALFALGFSAVIPLLGVLLAHESLTQMFLSGLSLAYATVPADLPVMVAVVLALGAYRMALDHAVARDLQAVETLSEVTVIATDKTGTLTEDGIVLKKLFPESNKRRILDIAALSSEGTWSQPATGSGAIESAFMDFARESGIRTDEDRARLRFRRLFSFDSVRKIKSVVYESPDGPRVAAKGAPESLLARSTRELGPSSEHLLVDTDRDAILMAANRMAAEGLRVVGLAEKPVERGALERDDAEYDLTFVGVAGFAERARPEVEGAVASCRAAGIRQVMMTGDHPLTAVAVAKEIGLESPGEFITGPELGSLSDGELDQVEKTRTVFARVTPQDKLRIIGAMHRGSEVVAATGDGADDGPALAAADVGMALGRGSDQAREAAGIVITDSNLTTIVASVSEGRTIFANLAKSVRFYLACKVALIAAALLPVLLLAPVPFAPIQIILFALFMDLGAAATFVSEPAESGTMKRPPRDRKAGFFDTRMTVGILTAAAGFALAVSAAYLVTWHLGGDPVRAQSVAFATSLVGLAFLAFNMRSEREPLSKVGPLSNRPMLVWMAAVIVFAVAATALPGVQSVFGTSALGLDDWALILPLSLMASFWMELRKILASGK